MGGTGAGAGLRGADLEALDALGRELDRHAARLSTVSSAASADVTALARIWDGPDSAQFRQQWAGVHRPKLNQAVLELQQASATIGRNRQAQDLTSAADGISGRLPTGPNGAAHLLGTVPFPGDDSVLDNLADFVFGDVANIWNGGDDGFPYGAGLAAALKINRMRAGELPLFNTGLVGRTVASLLQRGPGSLSRAGLWLGSDSASVFFRRAGIVGGVVSTGLGAYNLYQQGNPVDAFQESPAGYVADVASTTFSASTTAFLVTGQPVFAAVAVGSGVVWLGAEVVDNWDDITAWSSDAWDAGSDFVGDVGGEAAELAGDAWDAGSGFVGDVGGGAAELAGGLVSSVGDWF